MLIRVCTLIILLLLQAACSEDRSECIEPNDYGNLETKSVDVHANQYLEQETIAANHQSCSNITNRWKDSKIDVRSISNKLNMNANGLVDFCSSGSSLTCPNNDCTSCATGDCTLSVDPQGCLQVNVGIDVTDAKFSPRAAIGCSNSIY